MTSFTQPASSCCRNCTTGRAGRRQTWFAQGQQGRRTALHAGWPCKQILTNRKPQPAYVAVHHGVAGKGTGLDAQGDAGAGAALGLGQLQRVGAIAGLVPGGPCAVGLQLVQGQRHNLRGGGAAAGRQQFSSSTHAPTHPPAHPLPPTHPPHPPPTPSPTHRHGTGVQMQVVQEEAGEVGPLDDCREGRQGGRGR